MSGPLLPVTWRPRPQPLEARAVAARGAAAAALARRHLARTEPAAELAGVAAGDWLALTGPAEALPWVDGAHYFGADPAAPALLLPTTCLPSVPLPLLERALLRRFPQSPPPVLVLPAATRVFSLAAARPVDPEALRRWLEGRR